MKSAAKQTDEAAPAGLRARLAALKQKVRDHHAEHHAAHAARAQGPGRPAGDADEVARRVIEAATEQYMRLGFSAVTTDETARAVGISKKTLYQHFPSKDALLRSVVRANCEKHNAAIGAICRDATCSIAKRLKRMIAYVSGIFGELSPAIVHDMRRNAADAWDEIEENRRRCIHEDFGALLKEGRDRGDFRKDVDPKVFLMIYAETLRNVVNPQAFAQLGVPPARVFETVYKVLFEGILTEKARKEYT